MTEKAMWRPLTDLERALAERLLSMPVWRREEFCGQLRESAVRTIAGYSDDYGSIEFQVGEAAGGPQRLIAEAMAEDADNVPIEILLFEKGGKLSELEILKADGSEITRMPPAGEFRISSRTEAR